MTRYAITPNLVAGGNINPSSFVKLDPNNDFWAIQAGVGDSPLGISASGTDTAPGTPGATAFAAVAGEQFVIYGIGSIVELKAGATGFARGPVKADVNGYGVTAVSTNVVGALSLETVAAGELGRVIVLQPYVMA